MREVILFFFIVVAGTGGELCVSRAMKGIGEVHDFRPKSILGFVYQSTAAAVDVGGHRTYELGVFFAACNPFVPGGEFRSAG